MSYRQLETQFCPQALRHGARSWRIDELKVKETYASGKHSTVQRCNCSPASDSVVVKIFHVHQSSLGTDRSRVEREITIHKDLAHDNIVQVYAVFSDEVAIYMVQESVAGDSVSKQRADAGGYLPEAHVVKHIIKPLMSALQYLHAKGIIHRDIKPGNLRYDAQGRLKLLDFGLAVDSQRGAAWGCVGTLDYIAPEAVQYSAHNRTSYSFAADIWAVGILTYELLVGGPPFESPTKEETFRRISEEQPFIPSHLSFAAKNFIQQALCKDANLRPTADSLMLHKWLCGS